MIDILSGLLTVTGSVASIYGVYVLITSGRVKSWCSVEKGVLTIRRKIKESGWDPDIVIGLGVGEAVVGAMLAGSLGRKKFITIDRRYKWERGVRKTFVDTPTDLKLNPPPQKVILVTGEIYTGETIKLAIDYVNSKISSELKTAAMYVSENSDYYPDFYAYLIDKRVNPPWRLKGYPRDSKID